MGGINQPKPVRSTAHKLLGQTDETIDLELSIKIFAAQKEFAEFLIGIDNSLLEERRDNVDVSIHRMVIAADHLATSVDELGNAVMFLDVYIESLGHPNTPDGFKELLVEENIHKRIMEGIDNSNISEIIRSNGYDSGLSSVRKQLLDIENILKEIKKDTAVLLSEAKSGGIEKSLSVGKSKLRSNCHDAARRWSQLLLDWSVLCSIGDEAYRQFYSK